MTDPRKVSDADDDAYLRLLCDGKGGCSGARRVFRQGDGIRFLCNNRGTDHRLRCSQGGANWPWASYTAVYLRAGLAAYKKVTRTR